MFLRSARGDTSIYAVMFVLPYNAVLYDLVSNEHVFMRYKEFFLSYVFLLMLYCIFYEYCFFIHSGLVIYETQFSAVIRVLISAVKAVTAVMYVLVGAAIHVLVRAVQCSC